QLDSEWVAPIFAPATGWPSPVRPAYRPGRTSPVLSSLRTRDARPVAANQCWLDGGLPRTQDRGAAMQHRPLFAIGFFLCVLGIVAARIDAQRAGAFRGSTEDRAIKYSSAPLNNPVVEVNRRIQDGTVRLSYEGRSGFLRSALDALQIPVDSQLLVFSRASLPGKAIHEPTH